MAAALEDSPVTVLEDDIRADVQAAFGRIPPLWMLSDYIAVNPFLGFAGTPIEAAAQTVGDALSASVLPGTDYYRQKWEAGEFEHRHVATAAARVGGDAQKSAEVLNGLTPPTRQSRAVLTFAEKYDALHGTDWNDQLLRSQARLCAAYAAAKEGAAGEWELPIDANESLYNAWRATAAVDRSLSIAGLHGWKQRAEALPQTAELAIAIAMARLDVPAGRRVNYFHRLLGGLYGWANFFRRTPWAAGDVDAGELMDLLAIRLCGELAIVDLLDWADDSESSKAIARPKVEEEAARLVLQEAAEDGYVLPLIHSFNPPPTQEPQRPDVQAIFCIDVRSEVLRRHLEAQSDKVETRGFAGFFGVSLALDAGDGSASARCPALLKPGVKAGLGQSADFKVIKPLQGAPASAFSMVELTGLGYGVRLAIDAAAAANVAASDAETIAPIELSGGLDVQARTDLAAGILKNTGLAKSPMGRLVLLCGHAGRSANNAHAAGLDCGACGGHGGGANARVAAALLNDRQVQDALMARGVYIPVDTHFVPGVHDTSSDEVTLLDLDQVPATHERDIEALKAMLMAAGELTRAERAGALGIQPEEPSRLSKLLRKRAKDWSEVRPEWALARNATFIAARRSRTRLVNLDGRSFLHEYDSAADEDASILTLILCAPMVVASWINLQYFASTVDNDVFGSGDKTIHNRVGHLGVVLGNGGDLRTGLAKQSVHRADGTWHHQPLRLQVIVEAPMEKIDTVLAAQPGVNQLVANGWVRLIALDPHSTNAWLRTREGGWESVAN